MSEGEAVELHGGVANRGAVVRVGETVVRFDGADRAGRLRLVADAYGLDGPGRADLLDALDGTIARGGEFVQRRVEAGEAAFVEMWEAMGGMARFDRRRAWWAAARKELARALVEDA